MPFEPDYATPPGDTLRASLRELGMTQSQLAARTGLSLKHVNQIAQGVAPITHETALLLEKATGIEARHWNALEAVYRDHRARVEDRESLRGDLDWLNELPVKELRARNYLSRGGDHAATLEEILRFFGVANRASWEAVWRRPLASFYRSSTLHSDVGAVAAWLRIGELEAQSVEAEPYDARRFRESLDEVRRLTVSGPEEFVPTLARICAASGVAVVFVPEIKGARCWGVARWLTPTKALIELSLRYKADDHLWFSFFHEAAHILLHGKKTVFITTDQYTDEAEAEANAFAADFLIPREFDERLKQLSLADVRAFAKEIGIAPGIVVGRLQHDGVLDWGEGNGLKRRFQFSSE